jgi:DivIVA domain-containing protein
MTKDFSLVRKGYDPEQVDTYITRLENDLNAYKQKEKAITQAIINAQITADQIVENAKMDVQKMQKTTKKRLEDVQDMLDEATKKLLLFKDRYNQLISEYLIDFNEKDFHDLFEELADIRRSFSPEQVTTTQTPSPYGGTQAETLAEKIEKEESTEGVSKEEMESLFGKKDESE